MVEAATSTPLSYYNVTATLWGCSVQPLESLLGVILCHSRSHQQEALGATVVNALAKAGVEIGENGSIYPRPKGER